MENDILVYYPTCLGGGVVLKTTLAIASCSPVPFFYLHASCRSNFLIWFLTRLSLIYIIWPDNGHLSGWLKLPPFVSFCCRFIEFVSNGFDCVPTTMLNILPCVNFNSIRWKKASFCDSTGWFVKLCWQLERRLACQSDLLSTVDTQRAKARASAAWRWFKMMIKQLWHILRSTKSLSFSPVIHSCRMIYERILGWHESKRRPLCPTLWWLILSSPSRC